MPAIFTRLRVRILAIVLLAVIPAVGLIYHSAVERKRQISLDIEDNAVRLSRFLASNLERDLSEGQGFLNATSELLQAKLLSGDKCEDVLAGLLGNSPVYQNLGISGRDGRILCSGKAVPEGAGLSKLSWFGSILARRDFTVGFDFTGLLSPQASILLALPVSKSAGPPERIIFAVMDLDWLNKLAEDSRLPPGSVISVTNRNGEAVARYPDPDKWVGKPYPRAHILKDDKKKYGVKIANGIDGIKRLYAFATVPGKGELVVHVGIRREAIWKPANRALIRHMIALGIVSLLAILAAWFGSDLFLLKQVRTLITATKNLAQGNLGARSFLSYDRGELGDLARAFDEMAETLEWRDAQLRESEGERNDPFILLGGFVGMVPEPCLVLDESMNVLAGNDAAKGLLACPDEAALGRPLSDFLPGLSREADRIRGIMHGPTGPVPSIRIETGASGTTRVPALLDISFSKTIVSKKVVFMAIFRLDDKSGDAS